MNIKNDSWCCTLFYILVINLLKVLFVFCNIIFLLSFFDNKYLTVHQNVLLYHRALLCC